jgi:Zn finger protein HypA/HybF involved in hydrogenase expression
MHEIGLIEPIVAQIGERSAGRPVLSVNLRIGALHRVVPDALQMSWDLVAAGTPAAAALVTMVEIPASWRCRGCGAEVGGLCPCGSTEAPDLISGDELTIESVVFAAEPAAEPTAR